MSPQAVARQRLANQHLVAAGFSDPAQVVAALGAVQAQDFAGAKWAVAQRTRALDDASVEQAFIDGAIVRTHALRPTWHFVAADDLRWIQALTASRVHAANAYHYRLLGIDAGLVRRSHAALEKALRGGVALTRTEIAAVWKRVGIDTGDALRVGGLLMWAELDALICSGPRHGKQFTYALVDERLPPTQPLQRDEALAELARRYFSTRGPATVQDFSWWSGLTVADGKKAVALLGSALARQVVEGATFWFAEPMRLLPPRARPAQLLPNYDEFFIGFRDRSAMLQRVGERGLPNPSQAVFANVVAIDGQLVGGWKREIGARSATVRMALAAPLTASEHRAIEAAVQRYARFLGVPVAHVAMEQEQGVGTR
jgi:hypothetical protein